MARKKNPKPEMKEVHFSGEQQEAIAKGCDISLRIYSVTGGAGTGKTSVLGKMYKDLQTDLGSGKVALCAPTGRAAKRIQELTGIQAKTIHRLLEFPMPDDDWTEDMEPNKPRRNRNKPLDERVVVVDESSMLSPTLYAQLNDAMPNNGVLRYFGDNNQLAPVEEGKPPFIELLKNYEKTELTYNFRSDDAIVGNALRILAGSMPLRNERFEIIFSRDPIAQVQNIVNERFAEIDHQIIMPTRVGNFGTNKMNPMVQMKLNPHGETLDLPRPRSKFNDKDDDESKAPKDLMVRESDKFLWTKNDYKLGLFNGEIGNIDWVNGEDGSLGVSTFDRTVEVPPHVSVYSPVHGHVIQYDPRRNIELGYAITTHKSQGSEFDTVIYCCTSRAGYLLGRRNFYTAITRAKNRVILVMDPSGMSLSMRRYSGGEKNNGT